MVEICDGGPISFSRTDQVLEALRFAADFPAFQAAAQICNKSQDMDRYLDEFVSPALGGSRMWEFEQISDSKKRECTSMVRRFIANPDEAIREILSATESVVDSPRGWVRKRLENEFERMTFAFRVAGFDQAKDSQLPSDPSPQFEGGIHYHSRELVVAAFEEARSLYLAEKHDSAKGSEAE